MQERDWERDRPRRSTDSLRRMQPQCTPYTPRELAGATPRGQYHRTGCPPAPLFCPLPSMRSALARPPARRRNSGSRRTAADAATAVATAAAGRVELAAAAAAAARGNGASVAPSIAVPAAAALPPALAAVARTRAAVAAAVVAPCCNRVTRSVRQCPRQKCAPRVVRRCLGGG